MAPCASQSRLLHSKLSFNVFDPLDFSKEVFKHIAIILILYSIFWCYINPWKGLLTEIPLFKYSPNLVQKPRTLCIFYAKKREIILVLVYFSLFAFRCTKKVRNHAYIVQYIEFFVKKFFKKIIFTYSYPVSSIIPISL
jgi:hypothetical protein